MLNQSFSFEKSGKFSRLDGPSVNCKSKKEMLPNPSDEKERRIGSGSSGAKSDIKLRVKPKRHSEDGESDSSRSSERGDMSSTDKEQACSKHKATHLLSWQLQDKSHRHKTKELKTRSCPSSNRIETTGASANGKFPVMDNMATEANRTVKVRKSTEQTFSSLNLNYVLRNNEHGTQSSRSVCITRNESGSAYTTISMDNVQDKTTSTHHPFLNKKDDAHSSCSCLQNRDFSCHNHRWRDQICLCSERNRGSRKDGDSAVENACGSSVTPHLYTLNSLNHSKCKHSTHTAIEDKRDKIKGNRHKYCYALPRLRADENSNRRCPKRRYNILKVFPEETLSNSCRFCGQICEPPCHACNIISPSHDKDDSKVRKSRKHSSCTPREKDMKENYQGDLNSQLQSLVEYQALLFQNIQYLSAQLDHIISQLPKVPTTLFSRRDPKTKSRAVNFDTGASPSNNTLNDNIPGSFYDTNDGSPGISPSNLKGQQTHLVTRSTSATSNDTITSPPNIPGDSKNHQLGFDNALETILDSHPDKSKAVDKSGVELSRPVGTQSESQSQTPPCHPAPAHEVPKTVLEDVHSAVCNTKSGELNVRTARFPKLLKEMKMWKKELAIPAPLEGLPSTFFDRNSENSVHMNIASAKPHKSLKPSAAPRTRDMNWSSCRSGESASALKREQRRREGSNLLLDEVSESPVSITDPDETRGLEIQAPGGSSAGPKWSSWVVCSVQLALLLLAVALQFTFQLAITYYQT